MPPFWPITAEGWSAVAANAAAVVAALYAGFTAVPQLAAALSTLARREVTKAAEQQASASQDDATGSGGGKDESKDEFDHRRVAAVFALFERWKALRPRLRDEAHMYPAIADKDGYRQFVQRMLDYFDLMMLHRPDSQAEHWRAVLLGELIHHQAILKAEFSNLPTDQYGRDTRTLVSEAIQLGWQ